MIASLTIQQTAEASGLSVHTLRYYERIGLIKPIPRRSNATGFTGPRISTG
jgi:DNA-binding transcriptional MerR regulator